MAARPPQARTADGRPLRRSPHVTSGSRHSPADAVRPRAAPARAGSRASGRPALPGGVTGLAIVAGLDGRAVAESQAESRRRDRDPAEPPTARRPSRRRPRAPTESRRDGTARREGFGVGSVELHRGERIVVRKPFLIVVLGLSVIAMPALALEEEAQVQCEQLEELVVKRSATDVASTRRPLVRHYVPEQNYIWCLGIGFASLDERMPNLTKVATQSQAK